MRSLPSPHSRFMQLSQMAVSSCMRLEDVSDSRCCFLGKLIFQAKPFLFWWSVDVGRASVRYIYQNPPLCVRGKDRAC